MSASFNTLKVLAFDRDIGDNIFYFVDEAMAEYIAINKNTGEKEF